MNRHMCRLRKIAHPKQAVTLSRRQIAYWMLCLLTVFQLTGCDRVESTFQPNLVFMRNQKLFEDVQAVQDPELQQQISDISDAVSWMFGTADAPQIPPVEEISGLLDLDLLKLAAGPYRQDEDGSTRGLFRHHCAECHGVTGDGKGPLASSLDPYPRDYRRGIFKFKTTPSTTPPTRDDLEHVLRRGIPGTAMPSFQSLDDSQRRALVEYVRYLSMRGMFERMVITEVAMEFEPGDRLIDLAKREKTPSVFAAQEELLHELASIALESWIDPAATIPAIPTRPVDWNTPASVAYGRQLFFLTVTNCAECHGNLALGDGITDDYDEWTKELDPENPDVVADYLALGALPPRPTIPRNLHEGIYRGGADPETQFLRIRNGIAGTTMPSISTQVGDDEIWHLVAYVRSLHPAPNEQHESTR
jgi:mono/diheme cytochrome c family protein